MQNLNVNLLQTELTWEDPAANRDHFSRLLADCATNTDLAILPEMFTTGFSMRSEAVAEDKAAATLAWMQTEAERHDLAIMGSLAVREEDQIYNRLLFVRPDGTWEHYDKRHLFRMSGEHEHYAAGQDRVIVEWRGWRLCPLVCYDLRFPVWSRDRGDYDALVYVANWPAKRAYHWRQLLIARAIENQAYCIGLNRIGSDGNSIDYSGDSLAIAADGEIMLDCGNKDGNFHCCLDAEKRETYRRKFPSHMDGDNFQLL